MKAFASGYANLEVAARKLVELAGGAMKELQKRSPNAHLRSMLWTAF